MGLVGLLGIAGIAGTAAANPYDDGVAALRVGRITDALSLLQQAVDQEPGQADAWWELGWALWSAGDLAGCARAWDKVDALEPGRPDMAQWRAAGTTRAAYHAFAGALAPIETEPSEGARLRIVAGGDTMMGSDRARGEAALPPGDGDGLFTDVKPLLMAADIALLNLEGPLADGLPSAKCPGGSTACFAFRTPTRFAGALARAGVDFAQLANNHALDVGSAGQESTMRALDGVGIAHAGRYGDVGVIERDPPGPGIERDPPGPGIERDGLKVALVAAHSGSCCLDINELDEVRAAVAMADATADLVIFAYHGGAEGAAHRHVTGETEIAWGEKRGDVRALGHAAVDAGADLVVGSGPHVLRAMEVYQGRLIAYSLGNFLGYDQFGTAGGYGGVTVLLDVTLARNGVVTEAKLHPLALDAHSVPHPDPNGVALGHVRELSAADFPETGVRVGADGALSWGAAASRAR